MHTKLVSKMRVVVLLYVELKHTEEKRKKGCAPISLHNIFNACKTISMTYRSEYERKRLPQLFPLGRSNNRAHECIPSAPITAKETARASYSKIVCLTRHFHDTRKNKCGAKIMRQRSMKTLHQTFNSSANK